ncbi:MAG: carboxypeptidase-like regulatory domain-containing protein, partial [Gemmatimonadota bacterium]
MNPNIRFVSRAACLLALGAFFIGAAPVAAQQGTVQGTVTDARTGQPIGAAQISIVGTQRGTLSNAQGTFRITNVSAGEV